MVLAIIAAGEGSRLRAEGITGPKPLVRVHGEPLIGRIITLAVRNGITGVRCIINRQAGELRDYLMDTDFGVEMKLVVDSTPSSMHSLFALSPMLYSAPFILTTTDTVFREDEFRQFLERAQSLLPRHVLLAVTRFIDDEKPLCVAMDAAQRIHTFSDSAAGFSWATGGLYCLSPDVFSLIDTALERRIQRLRNFLRLMLASGYTIEGFPFSKIIDVDHARDIATAEEFLANVTVNP